jgi:hypothetical protein
MFTQVTLSQHLLDNGRLSHSQDHLQNHGAAIAAFKRAKKRGTWRRLLAWLTRRSVELQHFPTIELQYTKHAARGVQYIDLDNQFWPITEHSRARWVSIAKAMGTDKPLPPVQLIQVANGYVVRDGNHRVSVARAFDQSVIEAEII